MRVSLPAIAALAVGGLLLSNRGRRMQMPHAMERRRRPHVQFAHDDGPLLSVEESLVVRPPAASTLATLAALTAGGLLAWSQMRKSGESSVEESIVIDVPVSTAYNQWTQFEEFPKFMETVKEVKQIDDTHQHWRAEVGGKTKEWDAVITEQIPDRRIAWRSTTGVKNAGMVTFHKLSDSRTKVVLKMEYEPESLDEKIGDAMGAVRLTAKGNLGRFKRLVEARGVETGAWRGTVPQH